MTRRAADDHGIAHAVRQSALGALIESDEAPEIVPQHCPRRRAWRAVCGSYGPTAATESAVTCEVCKRGRAKRARAGARRAGSR